MSPEKDYRRKIKTREELRTILGARPRAKTVIMCHGTFDIVHPGHVRHLMYCRDKADLLVASLTSDEHIAKGNLRPYVPQDLRAMNLAALESVDYVIIDHNATPLENLRLLQPDFFAKGYEYVHGSVHPKTREEMDILESYGGEMIFTPGDVVYSSSAIVDMVPPRIAHDKLALLMKAEGVTFADLRAAMKSFAGRRVHVVGDTIVDTYSYCTVIGGGTKTPTLSVRHDHTVSYSGGAAVVAKHLRKAGANVDFSSVLGNDALRDFVLKDLKSEGIRCHEIVDSTRPTTQKNLFIAASHRLLKLDHVDNRNIADRIVTKLTEQVASIECDAIVFSDFHHGLFNVSSIPTLIGAIPKGPIKVADSQVASRWGNILDFKGFDLITPNEREARFALGDQDSVVRPMALNLFTKVDCKYLILKLGERGIITYRRGGGDQDPRQFFTIDSFVENLVDPVGAGDALLAYSTLALSTTRSEVVASILGSMAAAVACETDGNNPVSPEQVSRIIDVVEKRSDYT